MKLSKTSQLVLVSTIGLLVAGLISACQLVTVDYVFLAGAGGATGCNAGGIQTFAVDSETGALRSGFAPCVASGGNSPVAMAVSPDFANLYVANSDNDTVVHFSLASNGALTKKETITLPEPPTALAVNQASSFLYVAYGSTTANLAEYSLSSGNIGSATATEALLVPGFTGDTVVPTGVAVLPNNGAVYVSAYDQSSYNPGGTVTSSASPGWVFGFAVGSGGALSPAAASPYQTGIKPSALAAEATSRFIYVTDYASNHLIGYGVTSGSTLNFLISGPFKTGSEPSSIIVDPRAKYIYVSNALDSSVSSYAIDLTTGIPSSVINVTGAQINATDSQPVSVAVDPALGRFVYTANFLGNSVSGFQINPDTGALKPSAATPYPSQLHPTALVIVPHGNHSLESTSP
ncbi:MAG TPA: beta-propeller fold lactonase family protein [Terracidiphilus sp.]|nr:beta-propeller fold lactonase family protein [Terracidiphilus sp.]